MFSVGNYDGYKVYQLKEYENIPCDTEYLYITTTGSMYYGGVKVGRVELPGYRVISYDMDLFEEAMRQAREKGKKHSHSYSYKAVEEVEVPACVAETATPVGEDMNLCGTDEFFARVALDIDKMLKSVEQFNLD